MTNEELLLAMSTMMDTKLRAELQPLKNQMQDMQDDILNIKVELQDVKSDIQDMKDDMQNFRVELQDVKSDIQDMKDDMQNFRVELQDVKNDIQDMKDDMQNFRVELQDVKSDIQGMKDDIDNVKSELHHVKLFQENIIMPQLNTIQSCYLDTYHRYRDNADKMDAAFEDIDILKKVVAQHSEKLQAIS